MKICTINNYDLHQLKLGRWVKENVGRKKRGGDKLTEPGNATLIIWRPLAPKPVCSMKMRADSYIFFLRSLRRLMEKYEGEYVAVVGARVVAHGRDGKEVYDQARRRHPQSRILLGQVPAREAMVLWVESASHSRDRNLRLSDI